MKKTKRCLTMRSNSTLELEKEELDDLLLQRRSNQFAQGKAR